MRLAEATAVRAVRAAQAVGLSLGQVLEREEADPDSVIARQNSQGIDGDGGLKQSVFLEAEAARRTAVQLVDEMEALLATAEQVPEDARAGLLKQHTAAAQVLARSMVLAAIKLEE